MVLYFYIDQFCFRSEEGLIRLKYRLGFFPKLHQLS